MNTMWYNDVTCNAIYHPAISLNTIKHYALIYSIQYNIREAVIFVLAEFFHKRDEVKIRDSKVLDFLYEESKYNILTGRYPCEISDYIMLGGIQARLELGPYNPDTHTLSFIKNEMYRFLPEHASWSSYASCLRLPWRPASTVKNSPEARLIEQFKAIPSNAGHNRLVRKYLQFCWTLPYYGSAFFHGQIETPARSLTSLVINNGMYAH